MPIFSEKYGYYMEVLDAVGAKLTRAVNKVKASGDISPSVISPDICQQLKRIHFMKVMKNWIIIFIFGMFSYPQKTVVSILIELII